MITIQLTQEQIDWLTELLDNELSFMTHEQLRSPGPELFDKLIEHSTEYKTNAARQAEQKAGWDPNP